MCYGNIYILSTTSLVVNQETNWYSLKPVTFNRGKAKTCNYLHTIKTINLVISNIVRLSTRVRPCLSCITYRRLIKVTKHFRNSIVNETRPLKVAVNFLLTTPMCILERDPVKFQICNCQQQVATVITEFLYCFEHNRGPKDVAEQYMNFIFNSHLFSTMVYFGFLSSYFLKIYSC